MRILHVVATGKRRGAEIFAADLVRALGRDGLIQRVAVLQPDRKAVRYDAPTAYLAMEGVTLPGVRLDVPTVRGLARVVKRWPPDVIQAHGGETLKYILAATATFRRPPLVFRSIGLAPPRITRGIRRSVWTRVTDRAAKVVAVADAVRRQAIETFRIPSDRVVIIPNAVDPRRLDTSRTREEIRRSLALPSSAEVVLSLGALTWEKDPLSVLDIAERVLVDRPAALFLLAGDGPVERAVRSAIGRRRLAERVRLLGSRSDVAELLCASDLLLLASSTEGMPACVIEAGMARLPVAAYAVGGVPEAVVDERTGRLAPPGARDVLAGHVRDLLADGRARAMMGATAGALSTARFDIRRVAPAYVSLYEELFP
jgi:glycosyltransferase involved in cell wall biosynthesis